MSRRVLWESEFMVGVGVGGSGWQATSFSTSGEEDEVYTGKTICFSIVLLFMTRKILDFNTNIYI